MGVIKHGMFGTPTYESWCQMTQRCTNPNKGNYERYGGRGIKICRRWRKFENFLADMGVRPAGTQLERIDNDGNYEPSNCCWATPKQQARNRRSTHSLTHDGVTKTLGEWADDLGIRHSALIWRLNNGWSIERALTTTKINGRPRSVR